MDSMQISRYEFFIDKAPGGKEYLRYRSPEKPDAEVAPEECMVLFYRIRELENESELGRAQGVRDAINILKSREYIAEPQSQLISVRDVITGCINAVKKLLD